VTAWLDGIEPDRPTRAITVALVARDRRFLRVTSFLLARHGYAVETTHSSRNLADLLRRTDADVVVVDGSDSWNAGAQTATLLATLERPRGLVVVGESGDVRPLRAPAAVSKWTSFDCLLDEIERAYRQTHQPHRSSNVN
jgi:FixJ family two-component response regulator